MGVRGLRIGYSPYSPDLQRPGDRRRFPHYAKARELEFELADPRQKYDIVVLSARADLVSWSRVPRATRVVYDLIDSYLALPAKNPKSMLRGVSKYAIGELSRPVMSYRHAIESMAVRADAVICTTVEQQQALSRFCPNVHVILDFHSELGSVRKNDYRQGETLNLVWEGLPQNIVGLRTVADVLRRLQRERPLALHLITDLDFRMYLDRFGKRSTRRLASSIFESSFVYQWNTWALRQLAIASDLAIIPLDKDDALAAGKPENKLLLFWRLGVPALVSATPAHRRAMQAAELDMACDSPDEWEQALRRFADDEAARRWAGERGREYALTHFDETALLNKWDDVMESLL